MTWLRGSFIGLAGFGLFGFLGFQIFKPQIAMALFERAATSAVGANPIAALDDGLHVYLCGTGSPFPDIERAGPCIGVLAGQDAYVFDMGAASLRKLARMGFPAGQTQQVFLTHLHSDHFDGLGELMLQAWIVGGRSQPLPVAGPVGTSQVVAGFNQAYLIDSTYRTAHHGADIANPAGYGARAVELDVQGETPSQLVFEDGDFKVYAARVDHSPVEPAFGYRVEYKDRSIAISGDTVYSAPFVSLAKDTDLMLHEALQPEMVDVLGQAQLAAGNRDGAKILTDILDYHASPEDAARAAEAANAQQLIYYHIVPPLPLPILNTAFIGDAKDHFDGEITVGEDGMIFSLPSGSKEIDQTRGF